MQKLVLRDASVVVNSVDLSAMVDQVTITAQFDVVDVSSMGATYKQKLLGLGDGTIQVEFFTDETAASVNPTLWPLLGSNSTFTVVVKETSAAVSSTNPTYTMTSILPNFSPIAGQIGQASKTSVTFENASQTGIV